MSPKLQKASAIAVAAMIVSIVLGADGSGASAQSIRPAAINQEPTTQTVSQPVVQPLPAAPQSQPVEADAALDPSTAVRAASLAELVDAEPQPAELPRELSCLASAIYFEAKSESLAGQLAVGRVIVARSKSGRFPDSYCGVVYQPAQFSFVRGHGTPAIPRESRQWKNAVAIAEIAHANAWTNPVEGALYFHAARVSPDWRMARLGRIDNHVFYR